MMNNDVPTQETTAKQGKLKTVVGAAVGVILCLILVAGFSSCMRNATMPDNLKEAETVLEEEEFVTRYFDDEEEIEALFGELDLEITDATHALIGARGDFEELFFVVYCEDREAAEKTYYEFSGFVAREDSLYYEGYKVKRDYRTVYLGHKDLLSEVME